MKFNQISKFFILLGIHSSFIMSTHNYLGLRSLSIKLVSVLDIVNVDVQCFLAIALLVIFEVILSILFGKKCM